ncbi:MAG: hypothetical protein PWQ91_1199 [Eubacteriales bacterium]|nr:hypothetical protein [Eubacteriales bacterium]MDN5364138.1 hypothetical protein [Eubacteriales bacterium]
MLKALVIYGGGTFGGAEYHIKQLFQYAGNVVFPLLLAFRDDPLPCSLREKGAPVFLVPFSLRGLREAAQIVEQEGVAVLNPHGLKAALWALALKKLTGRPVVVTLHSVLEHDYRGWKKLLYQTTAPLIYSRADGFITVSRALANYLQSKGVKPEKIAVVYNGLDDSWFEIDPKQAINMRREMRSRFGTGENTLVLGTVARFHPVKGLNYAIQALKFLQHLPVELWLAGEGELLPELKRLAQEEGVKDRVRFCGFLEDVRPFYAAIDVYLQPSLMESFGITIVEALAFGHAVVASAVGGIPEIVDESVGILVPPGDAAAIAEAVVKLTGEQGWPDIYAQACRSKLERFRASIWAREWEKVICRWT